MKAFICCSNGDCMPIGCSETEGGIKETVDEHCKNHGEDHREYIAIVFADSAGYLDRQLTYEQISFLGWYAFEAKPYPGEFKDACDLAREMFDLDPLADRRTSV